MKIKNITFDALDQYALKYALTSPSENKSGLYSIYADNCIFQNFKTKNGGSIFKAYSGTKADTLSFTNTRFEDSYRGLNLSYDKDNIGKHNANVIMLKNSVFKNIEEHAVNYIRKPTILVNQVVNLLLTTVSLIMYIIARKEKF